MANLRQQVMPLPIVVPVWMIIAVPSRPVESPARNGCIGCRSHGVGRDVHCIGMGRIDQQLNPVCPAIPGQPLHPVKLIVAEPAAVNRAGQVGLPHQTGDAVNHLMTGSDQRQSQFPGFRNPAQNQNLHQFRVEEPTSAPSLPSVYTSISQWCLDTFRAVSLASAQISSASGRFSSWHQVRASRLVLAQQDSVSQIPVAACFLPPVPPGTGNQWMNPCCAAIGYPLPVC